MRGRWMYKEGVDVTTLQWKNCLPDTKGYRGSKQGNFRHAKKNSTIM